MVYIRVERVGIVVEVGNNEHPVGLLVLTFNFFNSKLLSQLLRWYCLLALYVCIALLDLYLFWNWIKCYYTIKLFYELECSVILYCSTSQC